MSLLIIDFLVHIINYKAIKTTLTFAVDFIDFLAHIINYKAIKTTLTFEVDFSCSCSLMQLGLKFWFLPRRAFAAVVAVVAGWFPCLPEIQS